MKILLFSSDRAFVATFAEAVSALQQGSGASATSPGGPRGASSGTLIWSVFENPETFLSALAEPTEDSAESRLVILDLEGHSSFEAISLMHTAAAFDESAEFAVARASRDTERRLRTEFQDIHITFVLDSRERADWRQALSTMATRSRLRRDLKRASQPAFTTPSPDAPDDALRTEDAAEQAYQASHDSLTQLANRRTFVARLDELVADPRNKGGVILIDLDKFKPVNDSLGHEAGDDLLRQVAVRLQHCLDSADLAARLGGDEFAVILRDIKSAKRKSELILSELHKPFTVLGSRVSIGGSLGVAEFSDGVRSAELMRRADEALYAAKRAGRGRVLTFGPAMMAQARRREAFVLAVKTRMLSGGAAPIALRDVREIHDGAVVASEPLLDWRSAAGGEMVEEPQRTIEEAGLGDSVGVWTVHGWAKVVMGGGAPFLVPLTLTQLRTHAVSDALQAVIQSLPDPTRLLIAVAESALAIDQETTLRRLERWRGLGARICVDEVGAGIGDLVTLAKLRPSAVRLSSRLYEHALAERSGLSAAMIYALQCSDAMVLEPTLHQEHTPQLRRLA